MRSNRQIRGFSLIEALIVMVLMIGAVTISLSVLATAQREQRRTALVNEQATEMARLTTATKSYLRTAEGLSETEGEIFAIAPADLIAAGLLPADFAKRPASGTNVPVSPMGQVYSVTAALTPDGYRALVVPTGTPNAGFLARAGVANTAQDILEYSAAVMQRMRQQYEITSSVITKDTKAVDSAVSGYSYDLTAFLSAAPAVPTVVGMANFSELDITADSGGGGGDGSNRTCTTTVDAACPAGTSEQWQFTTCEDWGSDHMDMPDVSSVATAGGTVIIRRFGYFNTNPGPAPPLGAGNNLPFRSEFGQLLVLPTSPVGDTLWVNAGADASRSSITHTNSCGTNREYKPYKLRCPSTGQFKDTWYEPICGAWYEYLPKPGDECSPAGYAFASDAMYQSGLTDATRGLTSVGVGSPVIPTAHSLNNSPYIETMFDSDPVVRTLSTCPGSENTLPIKVHKKDLGGGQSFEYMELRQGDFSEEVTSADHDLRVSVRCERVGYTAANSIAVPTGHNVVNACPQVQYLLNGVHNRYAKGIERYALPWPESERKKVIRMCCS